MPADFLDRTYSFPLEREFESWIVWGIEDYFRRIGLRYAIIAVGPDTESTWPADEALTAHAKLFGLQFKQAKLAKPKTPDPDRLHWTLHSPIGQLALVKAHSEIYYCLPTFMNRNYRFSALHHCIFWRPDDTSHEKNVWYANSAAASIYSFAKTAMRWGLFIESLLSCDIGLRVRSRDEGTLALQRLRASLRYSQLGDRPNPDAAADDDDSNPLYAFAVGLASSQ